ncbi:MAG: hypothetical protein KY463_14245 [Actinobacteria bacterium]|nr:hypothetical protein [Actinomycetota bacterium]
MTIEYMTETGRLRVEHVEESEVRRWTAEHPLAIILRAVPDRLQTD